MKLLRVAQESELSLLYSEFKKTVEKIIFTLETISQKQPKNKVVKNYTSLTKYWLTRSEKAIEPVLKNISEKGLSEAYSDTKNLHTIINEIWTYVTENIYVMFELNDRGETKPVSPEAKQNHYIVDILTKQYKENYNIYSKVINGLYELMRESK